MRGNSNPLNSYSHLLRSAQLQSDLQKFHNLIEQLNTHKETLNTKVTQRTEELQKNEEELKAVEESVKGLKDRVGRQDLSAEDVRRMQGERARLEVSEKWL